MLSTFFSKIPVDTLSIYPNALITTNFANLVRQSVIVAFAEQYLGIPTVSLSMSVTIMDFVSLLPPATSPWSGIIYNRASYVCFCFCFLCANWFPYCKYQEILKKHT